MNTTFRSITASLILLTAVSLNAQNEEAAGHAGGEAAGQAAEQVSGQATGQGAAQASGAEQQEAEVIPTTPIPDAAVGKAAEARPDSEKVIELPSSDARENFSYQFEKNNDSYAVVNPADGSGPIQVSKGFLGMVMSDPDMSDAKRLEQLKAYQPLTEQARKHFFNDTFPDSSKQTKPYQTNALQAGDNDVIIEQDPKAGPYARVTITDKAGKVVKEFSLAKNIVDEIMNHPSMTLEQKVELLGQSNFHLPEEARENFAKMTREEFEALIEAKPEVARQEFTKMNKVFAEAKLMEEKRRQERLTASASSEVAPSVSSSSSKSGRSVSAKSSSRKAIDIEAEVAQAKPAFSGKSNSASSTKLLGILLVAALALGAFGYTNLRTARS